MRGEERPAHRQLWREGYARQDRHQAGSTVGGKGRVVGSIGSSEPEQAAQASGSETNEQALVEAIEPWLAHMTWRPDFAQWRDRRIWQENHQATAVRDIKQVLGGRLEGRAVLDLGSGMGGL